jgi:hypothetical protein
MPPDQLLLFAVLMPACAGIVLLMLPSSPWARIGGDARDAGRRHAWLSGVALATALCMSLVVTDGWPWASAWSSWKLIYVSAAVIAVAGAAVSVRGVPRTETIALAAAAAVLWYRVPEARDIPVRIVAAAVAAAVAWCVWRGARSAPALSCAAAAVQACVLAGLLGSCGSSKVAAAAAAVAVTLGAGAVATRASRTFSCAAAAALVCGGCGVALALYGRGYHDSVQQWVWWAVAALPAALCMPWALKRGSRADA